MAKIIDHYEIQQADDLKTLDLAKKTLNYLPHEELLEIVQCKLEEVNVSVDSLVSLEEQLKTALSVTRCRKTELMMELLETLQQKEKLLGEENQLMASQLTKMEMKSTLPETDDEREAMSPENRSGRLLPETLPLLK